jgi:hypothetical protein
MGVDEPRRDDQSLSTDETASLTAQSPHGCYLSIFDGDIGAVPRIAGAVHNPSALDDDVEHAPDDTTPFVKIVCSK